MPVNKMGKIVFMLVAVGTGIGKHDGQRRPRIWLGEFWAESGG